jgi:hypothetical protein
MQKLTRAEAFGMAMLIRTTPRRASLEDAIVAGLMRPWS